MKTYSIKTYRSGSSAKNENLVQNPHFFILNKGLNSGKPLKRPCPNCFVISFENANDKDFFYWLVYGLWQSKAFHPFLRGSVIPFIVLPELKKSINQALITAENNLPAFEKDVKMLNFLSLKEKELLKTIHLVEVAQQSIFSQYKRRQL